MKLRNKKTGEIKECYRVGAIDYGELSKVYYADEYNSLAELNEEWEDYEPVEPIFDEKIRRGIRAWWDMQDNPFKSACVMLKSKNQDDACYSFMDGGEPFSVQFEAEVIGNVHEQPELLETKNEI